ncbi:hypothetical protein RI065_04290 [Mycoplasmatota bacterium zrk1]
MVLSTRDNGKYFKGVYSGFFSKTKLSGIIKKVNLNKVSVQVVTTIDGWTYVATLMCSTIHEVSDKPIECIDVEEIKSAIKYHRSIERQKRDITRL